MSRLRNRWRKVRDAYPWRECARVFAERGWGYGLDGSRVPDEAQLRATADRLFESSAKSMGPGTEWVKTMSGRMLVYIDDEGCPFIVTEALSPQEYTRLTVEMRIDADGTRADGGGHA